MDLANKRPLVAYAAKACALLLLLFVLARTLPLMPPACAAVFWAVLTSVSCAGVMYQVVIRKTHRQFKLVNGGVLARINNGRALSLTVSFIVSAACMASLLLEAPKWDVAEWLLIAAAVVLFPAVGTLVRHFVAKEYERPFQTAGVVLVTCVVVALLLCAAYVCICAFEPAESFETLLQAFLATPQPFEKSPCAILSEAGILTWVSDACTKFFVAKTYTVFQPAYLLFRVILCAGAFFGFANLLGICSLNFSNLKKVFLPLEAIKAKFTSHNYVYKPIKRYIFVACLLPVALVAGFLYANSYAESIQQTQEYTWAQSIARSLAGQAVYVKDGKYYDKEMVNKLLYNNSQSNEADGSNASLNTQANELKNTIQTAYNGCLNNVDAFLDWYFNLPSNASELSALSGSNANTAARDKFSEVCVAENDEGINSAISTYLEQVNAYITNVNTQLEKCEITNVPAWLLVTEDFPTSSDAFALVSKAEGTKTQASEIGVTSAIESNTSVMKQSVESAVFETSTFSTITSNISNAASRAGSVLNVLNIVDTQLIDQASNRSKYKGALQSAIIESRDKLLSIVGL